MIGRVTFMRLLVVQVSGHLQLERYEYEYEYLPNLSLG